MAYIGRQEPEGTARSRGRKRRWTLPAPPGLTATGLEGGAILDEVPGPLGVELWQRFRDAVLWNDVPDSARNELFRAGSTYLNDQQFEHSAAQQKGAHGPLRVFSEMFGGHDINPRTLAQAALRLSEWATSHGYDETAALFAGLAAQVRKHDPDMAFAAGRAERRCGRYERAGEWFLRAIGLARRSGDDAAYASAFLGWGLMEEQRGNREAARQKYLRAWRASMRGSLHQLAAAARHNMIALAVPDDPFEAGLAHVIAAYKLYDDCSVERLALLALDGGVFLAEHGYFASAMRLYDAAARHIVRPAVITALHANVARAAAAVGDHERFRSACARVTNEDAQNGEFAPAALAEVARAAHTLGLGTKALGLANEALTLAGARGAVSAERAANEVIAAVRERRGGDVARESPPRVSRFIQRFVRRLAAFPDPLHP